MTNFKDKTTFELNAMIADIQIELKLREMMELQAQAKEVQANVDYQTADISGGIFANPTIANNQNYICNRFDFEYFSKGAEHTRYKDFVDETNEIFTYEISRGDIFEFISFDGKLKDNHNVNSNYVLILNINSSEIEYQEFKNIDDAFEAFKAMPEGKKDKAIDELSEKEIVDLIFKKDHSKSSFENLYSRLSDITKNVYRDAIKSNGFEAA